MRLSKRALITAFTGLAIVGAAVARTTPALAGPPADPTARGTLTLCGPTGAPVIGGTLGTAPFVWKAVSSQPAPTGYSGAGQNADLAIYQVRPGIDPGDWSGDQLTADTEYQQSSHPVAQATSKDISLQIITSEYPPMGDGYYELRMYFGKLGYGQTTEQYPSAFIQVDGNAWRLVAGGGGSCAPVGKSSEVFSGAAPAAPAPSYAAEVAAAQHVSVTDASGSDSPPAGSSTSNSPVATGASESDKAAGTHVATEASGLSSPSRDDTGHAVLIGLLAGLGVVVVGVGGTVYALRRRP